MDIEPRPRHVAASLAFARCAAVAVVALGTMALVGWVTGVELLKSFLHPGKIAMNPATAACFILGGVALWLSLPFAAAADDAEPAPGPRRRAGVLACAGAVVLVGVLKLATFFGFWNVGVDRVLFRAQLGDNVMAPNTAFTFVLVGSALLLLDVRVANRLRPARLLTLAATAVALLALIGYLYDVAALYKPTQKYIAMALNTAMGFLALALGLLAARPDREPIRTLISDTAGGVIARRLLPAALLLPIVLGWLHLRAVADEAVLEHVGFPVMVTTLLALATLVSLTWGTARSLHRVDVERARAERAVADNYRLMRTLIDNLPDYIFVKDTDNRFLINNTAHVRVLGAASQADVLGKRDEDFFGPAEAARFHRDDAEVIRTGVTQSDKEERVVHDPGGQERWVSTTKVPFRDADGDVAGLVGIAHDITERKRAESLLRAQNELLDEAARAERQSHDALKRAQSQLVQSEKLASLGQMVAGVAHEINNPLSFVANNVAVLQRDLRGLATMIELYRKADPTIGAHEPALAAEVREAASRLDVDYTLTNIPELLARSREGLRRIQQIVKDLRDFARLDESDLHDVDLNEGIRSTVNIILGLAKKRQVKVEMDLGPLPAVSCYPAKVNQVVMNLLANAIQASHEGGTVTVRSSAENGAVRIRVADQGAGIPEHIRGRIFDPFFTTKPPGEGTGLGLSISYGIIQDHGGRIDVETETGKGSTFTVTLPVRKRVDASSIEQVAAASSPSPR